MKARDVSVWVKVAASIFIAGATVFKLATAPASVSVADIVFAGFGIVAVWLDVAVNLIIEKFTGAGAK